MKTKRYGCVWMLFAAVLLLCPGKSVATEERQAKDTEQSSVAARVSGEWNGTLTKLRLVFKFEASGDGVKGELLSVDQGNTTVAVDSTTVDASGAIVAKIDTIGASFEGKLNEDASEIVGAWHQGGASLPLVLRRPGAAPKFTLKARTQGQIALEPCRSADGNTEGYCAKYEVFENRQTKQGRKIALNIFLLPARAAKVEVDPFFALAGGPGQSATEAFVQAGYTEKIREHRDVVLVDQRGTGGSNGLQCRVRRAADAQSMLGEGFSLDRIRECRAESDKKADTTQYTTSIFADDLDEVRKALGYDKIDVFGGSYGTKAALVYLRLHGEHVRSLALEAVAPPTYRIPMPFAKTIQASLGHLVERCAADAECHKAFPDLDSELRTVVERLAKAPAEFEINGEKVTMPRDVFVANLRNLLYVPQFVSAFPYLIHSAYQGNWVPYATATLQMIKALSEAVARGASFAAICAEDVPGFTEEMIHKETDGTYLGDSQVRRYQEYCKAWGTVGNIPKDYYAPIKSNVPTLLIAGALDPATPPEMAEAAAKDLPNSRVVVVKEGTHGTGDPCLDGLIAEFVEKGSAKEMNVGCVDKIHLPAFRHP